MELRSTTSLAFLRAQPTGTVVTIESFEGYGPEFILWRLRLADPAQLTFVVLEQSVDASWIGVQLRPERIDRYGDLVLDESLQQYDRLTAWSSRGMVEIPIRLLEVEDNVVLPRLANISVSLKSGSSLAREALNLLSKEDEPRIARVNLCGLEWSMDISRPEVAFARFDAVPDANMLPEIVRHGDVERVAISERLYRDLPPEADCGNGEHRWIVVRHSRCTYSVVGTPDGYSLTWVSAEAHVGAPDVFTALAYRQAALSGRAHLVLPGRHK